MIHHFSDVTKGFDVTCDAVVVGTGAGGAVSAANLARAGMKVVALEAGPEVRPSDMTREAPKFLARYFWEGGLRVIGGSAQIPSMQGRCLGGSTVMNSAIMLPLPKWIRELWAKEAGLDFVLDPTFDAAYARVFEKTKTQPTPMAVMGRRNLIARDALAAVGLKGSSLPRAVEGCEGCADCITGCTGGHKQSVDRCYIPDAMGAGAEVFTCSAAERILTEGSRATGVTGWVVEPFTHQKIARFTVRAKKVVLAAGTMHTPVLLLSSGIHANHTAGSTLFAHLGGGIVGIMEEVVDPWIGATQGWGAVSEEIPGMKFESLWAAPSLIMVRWGDVGLRFLERLGEIKHAALIALVYRGDVRGTVKPKWNGLPSMKLWIPDREAHVVLRGMKLASDALLKVGARFVYTGIPGTKDQMRSEEDTGAMLNAKLKARDLSMTANHVFGSCRMSKYQDGTVDLHGKVRGIEDLYITDASIFPSSSAVNPQATIMALADVISRRIGDVL